jgi:NADPH2:quinone reductase
MRGIQVRAPGGPEALEPVELPDPVPGDREALVRVTAAGVNFLDIYHRTDAIRSRCRSRRARKAPAWSWP